jgi:hypothetical protein
MGRQNTDPMGFLGLCDELPFRAGKAKDKPCFKKHLFSGFPKTHPQNQKAHLSHPYRNLTK